MDVDRRTVVRGAAALVVTVGCASVARAQNVRDGRTPITRDEWDAIIRGSGHQFNCVQATAMTEGPFYYESSWERSELAEGRSGERLRLGITLGGIGPTPGCIPLRGAVVDVWHTDATGLYSNVGADLQPVDTTGQTFMRGHQVTDEEGYVEFETIMPGWEIVAAPPPVTVALRTTHIHVKAYHGREVLTTQLFFPDALLNQLYAEVEPYKSHVMLTAPGLDRAYTRIPNGEDIFFNSSRATPMKVERINGILTAKAVIGVLSEGSRGFRTLFR